MCERLVRLGHPVCVFALLHRAAAQVRGVEEFVRELLVHRLAVAARARVADQPADAEREAAVRIHFYRHLVVRAADATRFHFEARLDVVDRLLEHLQRIVAALLLDDVEGLVNDALGGTALTVAHHAVDELAHERTLIDRVRRNVALRNLSSSRHITESRYFGLRMSDCGISDSSIRNSEIRYPRSHMSRFLRPLRAVLRSSLHPSLHADGVERAANHVIANTGQVLHAAAANQHQRVFLEVVTHTGDVGRHLDAVGQPYARDLAQRGIRLLGRLGKDAHAYPALLRAVLQGRALGLADNLLAARANELADSRHSCTLTIGE